MSLLIQLKVKNMIFLNKKMSLKNEIFIGYLLVYMENVFFFLFSYKSKFKSSTLQVLQESCFGALT